MNMNIENKRNEVPAEKLAKTAEINGIKISIGSPAYNPNEYTLGLTDGQRNLGVTLNNENNPEEAFDLAVELAKDTKDITDLQEKIVLGISRLNKNK